MKKRGKSIKRCAVPREESRRGILRDFERALVFTLALLALKSLAERTLFGEHLQLMTYNIQQHRLSSTRPNEDLPVQIVDISDLETVSSARANHSKATPRDALRQLITVVAQQWPRAIGVDIDFSPDAHGYVTPEDPEFFEFCLKLRAETHIPILLGVERAQGLPIDAWLGSADFRELAASIMIPRDSKRMVRWVQIGAAASRGSSMSTGLAEAYNNAEHEPPRWIGWAVEHTSEKRLAEGVSVGEFLIDYSPLEALEKERLRTKNPVVISDQGWHLRDKVVFIGDATRGMAFDNFVIPDRQEPLPGVYVHACAAYTLIKAPLYELTGTGRVAMDLLLSLFVFGGVALMPLCYMQMAPGKVAAGPLQNCLTWLVAILVVLGGAWLVRTTRLMWDDFMLVTAVLILHRSAERSTEQLGGWVRNTIPSAWHRLVFNSGKEDHS